MRLNPEVKDVMTELGFLYWPQEVIIKEEKKEPPKEVIGFELEEYEIETEVIKTEPDFPIQDPLLVTEANEENDGNEEEFRENDFKASESEDRNSRKR